MNEILLMIIGLAFFLFGMNVMSGGLKKMAGSKLENTLQTMTSNKIAGIGLGAVITVAVQSSSAVTVMLVGLVNSGIMMLSQTIGVIMGANIGTTLTAWLMSLIGIESDNFFINLLKPKSFAPIFAIIGVFLLLFSKKTKKKDLGNILVGFSVLMYGMVMMSEGASPLTQNEKFVSMLTFFRDSHAWIACILGIIVGAVFTGVIQSSAASIGILQAISLGGGLNFGLAVPLIFGLNIGTCVTSLLSSIGVNKNAKRVAVIHTSIKVIGTVICLALFYGILAIIGKMSFLQQSVTPVQIALAHTIFNILTTIVLLPFSKQLEKLSFLIVKDKADMKEEYEILDDRLLNTPAFAVSECGRVCTRMAQISIDAMKMSLSLLNSYDQKTAEKIREMEETVDIYEDKLGTFLVKLSEKALSDKDSRRAAMHLHSLSDFERISDHAVDVLDAAEEMREKKVVFSPQATQEIHVICNALNEILDNTLKAVEEDDEVLARSVEPLEQVIDLLKSQIKDNHISRLQGGTCTIELGFILSDILTSVERVSDHCSNIAAAVLEVKMSRFDSHNYLNSIKTGGNEEFNKSFEMYRNKYTLA